MASISCPCCSNGVSDLAPLCPKSRKPIAATRTEPTPPERRAPGMRTGTLFVLNLLVLFGFLFAVAFLTSRTLPAARVSARGDRPLRISPEHRFAGHPINREIHIPHVSPIADE